MLFPKFSIYMKFITFYELSWFRSNVHLKESYVMVVVLGYLLNNVDGNKGTMSWGVVW